MSFYNDLARFDDLPALVDAETGEVVSYCLLDQLIQARISDFGAPRRGLVFLEVRNDIKGIVDYLAVLRAGHVLHLVESVSDEKTKRLIDHYLPNLVLGENESGFWRNERTHTLHPNLTLLLSTSGSTGVPKFVKLSTKNLYSNAMSIAQYLDIQVGQRAFCHLKPYYSYGMSVINSHLAVGGVLVLTRRAITDSEFLKQMKRFSANSLAGVPYTFEYLEEIGFDANDFPSLFCLTQAGGRLKEDLIRKYAKSCRESGKKFIVMYGQTEASPRISYLPFEWAESHPNSIGVPIPGGELFVVDEDRSVIDNPNVQGELAYRGPNVMMGYASSPEELEFDETPDVLYTGDIAKKNETGLFQIVGRTSRFVKLFGLRINLDQIEIDLKRSFDKVLVAGDDEKIVVGLGTGDFHSGGEVLRMLVDAYHLPTSKFILLEYEEFPQLPNGKYDYKRLLADSVKPREKKWYRRLLDSVWDVLELNDRHWITISEMYAEVLAVRDIKDLDTFESLGGDSLSYVALSIEIERVLGDKLPTDWPRLPVSELDAIYAKEAG